MKNPVLMTAENPNGWKLEDLLDQLVVEVQAKTAKISTDERPEARTVAGNNRQIIKNLKTAARFQRHSFTILRGLGPDQGPTGNARIGRTEYTSAAPKAPRPWKLAENEKRELNLLLEQGLISVEKHAEECARIGSANKQYTYDELKALVIAVTTEMDQVRPGMFHPNFTELCIMIAAHESLMGEHRVQIGGGPARGLLQIEELTYASVWQHSDTIAETAMRMGMQCDFSQIEQGDRHSIYICRHRIAMDSEPLPRNAFEMADYAKRIWNGPGKATADDYYNAYMRCKNA